MRVRVCGTKSGNEVAGKICLQGSKASIELNINSSFCFSKNSHFMLFLNLLKDSILHVLLSKTLDTIPHFYEHYCTFTLTILLNNLFNSILSYIPAMQIYWQNKWLRKATLQKIF